MREPGTYRVTNRTKRVVLKWISFLEIDRCLTKYEHTNRPDDCKELTMCLF